MGDEQGQSIREMAEAESLGEGQEQLFEGAQFAGDELSLDDLIKQGKKRVVTVSFRSAEFDSPSDGGLLRPTKQGLALVTYQWEKPDLVPLWEEGKPRRDNPEIVGWKVRQVLTPIWVEKLDGEAGIIEANFAELLDADAGAAGALLASMTQRYRKAMGLAESEPVPANA